jgi:transposase
MIAAIVSRRCRDCRGLPTRAEWSRARCHIDYHVEVARRYYSAPYALIGRELEVRLTERTVELFHRGERVASHVRLRGQTRYSTQIEHMPPSHRAFAQWTPDRLVRWAQSIGLTTARSSNTFCRPAPSAAGLSRVPGHSAARQALR